MIQCAMIESKIMKKLSNQMKLLQVTTRKKTEYRTRENKTIYDN